jgi:hypothetical protein
MRIGQFDIANHHLNGFLLEPLKSIPSRGGLGYGIALKPQDARKQPP